MQKIRYFDNNNKKKRTTTDEKEDRDKLIMDLLHREWTNTHTEQTLTLDMNTDSNWR